MFKSQIIVAPQLYEHTPRDVKVWFQIKSESNEFFGLLVNIKVMFTL